MKNPLLNRIIIYQNLIQTLLSLMKVPQTHCLVREKETLLILRLLLLPNISKLLQTKLLVDLCLSSPNSKKTSRIAREMGSLTVKAYFRVHGAHRCRPRQVCSLLCRHTLLISYQPVNDQKELTALRNNPKLRFSKRLLCWHLNSKENANQPPLVFVKERMLLNLSARTTTPSLWLWRHLRLLEWRTHPPKLF